MKKELKTKRAFTSGSALILTVVLTSLLALVGVVFVMLARVDKLSTSAIAENKQLNLAVDSVIAKIADELAWDVPSLLRGEEYYDYPGYTRSADGDGTLFTFDDVVTGDPWLASLEPEHDANGTPLDLTDDIYYWQQISDIYEVVPGSRVGLLEGYGVGDWWEASGFGDKVQPHNLRAQIIAEADSVTGAVDASATYAPIDFGGPADADGDGVADSRWVKVPDMSSKGRDIYAAVRVVDNGAMLNVNTGYKFDPNNPGFNGENIDGSSQMHINLAALSQRGANGTISTAADYLQYVRCGYGAEPNDIFPYEQNVVWRYNQPAGSYTPFDISDELKLRNRYILNYNKITTRIERMWTWAYDEGIEMPRVRGDYLQNDPEYWFYRTNNSCVYDPCLYDYRHISTTYNMDRIIDPDGRKMFNVNRINPVAEPNVIDLYAAIRTAILDANVPVDPCALAAQIAVNIKDYGDNEQPDTITPFTPDPNRPTYYGFERPCIYISELAYNIVNDTNDPNKYYRSYAIELHKPYFEDDLPVDGQWLLKIDDVNYPIVWSGISRFHVMLAEDANAPLEIDFNDITPTQGPIPHNGARGAEFVDTDFSWPAIPGANSYDMYLGTDLNIGLEFIRRDIGGTILPPLLRALLVLVADTDYYWRIDAVDDANNVIVGDVWTFSTSEPVPQYFSGYFSPDSLIQLRRLVVQTGDYITVDSVVVPDVNVFDPNVSGVGCFQRDIAPLRVIKRLWSGLLALPTLGYGNLFSRPDVAGIQYFPANYFNNIGEIGKVFRVYAYDDFDEFTIEDQVKIDLANPQFQQLFNYLTRFDPSMDLVDNDGDGAVDEQDGSEFKVPGRININTAPWYVIAQLPWASFHTPNYELARAIADYRAANGPFTSIGELNRVAVDSNDYRRIDYYARLGAAGDQLTFPDLSGNDGVPDDFEERDLIFARISDLVTVRSDVFTAYILVRIGTDGPQKRVVAILDRSDAYTPAGRVRVRALYPVPDPR